MREGILVLVAASGGGFFGARGRFRDLLVVFSVGWSSLFLSLELVGGAFFTDAASERAALVRGYIQSTLWCEGRLMPNQNNSTFVQWSF